MLRWFLWATLAAVGIAWVAALIHTSGRAPVGLVSIGLGMAVGAAANGIASLQPTLSRHRLLLAVSALALLAVVAQHAWLYLDFRRQWHEDRAKSPHAALFRSEEFQNDSPLSPIEYFRRELTPARAALWALDAVLVVASASAIMWIANRKPGERKSPLAD